MKRQIKSALLILKVTVSNSLDISQSAMMFLKETVPKFFYVFEKVLKCLDFLLGHPSSIPYYFLKRQFQNSSVFLKETVSKGLDDSERHTLENLQ